MLWSDNLQDQWAHIDWPQAMSFSMDDPEMDSVTAEDDGIIEIAQWRGIGACDKT